jgi:hypothetical protein
MATLGDPLADLAVHHAYRAPAFAPVIGGSAASTSRTKSGQQPAQPGRLRCGGRTRTRTAAGSWQMAPRTW